MIKEAKLIEIYKAVSVPKIQSFNIKEIKNFFKNWKST